MRRLFSCLWLVVISSLIPTYASAQNAILVADSVEISGTSLIAEGNVEVLQGDRRLLAEKIVYNDADGSLTIEGPLILSDATQTVILADSAQLDETMTRGILNGARLILNEQVQIAGHKIIRHGTRYTQLYKIAATSCKVCHEDEAPIWQIRARRAIHDTEKKQLYFDDVQLRVYDLPILWLPRLRLPDPTLDRASGFLVPSVRQSSDLGFGIRTPYFIKIGDHKDLTLTPFIASKTTTLEWRYRQAFAKGNMEWKGAISKDDLRPDLNRGYIFGSGQFDLKRDFTLDFNLQAQSDPTYHLNYGYHDQDRLNSNVGVERIRRDELISARLHYFHTLRDTESNATLPTTILHGDYERRLFPSLIGGEIRLNSSLHAHRRYSDVQTDGADYDIWADGRDASRLTANLEWRNSAIIGPGIETHFNIGARVQSLRFHQNGPMMDSSASEIVPYLQASLQWPWVRVRDASTHTITPVVMVGWAGGNQKNIPFDESTHSEFDEGNLLSLSRFSGDDRFARGVSAAAGMNWSYDGRHLQTNLTYGTVYQRDVDMAYSASSGLDSKRSDHLISGQIKASNGLQITARGLFDSQFSITKAEARANWRNKKISLSGAYTWLEADLAEDRPDRSSTWTVNTSYRLGRHWTGLAEWEYDLANNQSKQGQIGLQYQNECVRMNFTIRRRLTNSGLSDPSTDIGFNVNLLGFSSNVVDNSYARTCRTNG